MPSPVLAALVRYSTPGAVLRRRRRLAQQREAVAEIALGRIGGRGLAIPFLRRGEVAHRLGAGGKDVGQQCLPVRRPGLGGEARPVRGLDEVGARGVGGGGRGREQAGGGFRLRRHPVHVERAQQRLGRGIAVVGGAFEPAGALGRAGRHPGTLQIGRGRPGTRPRHFPPAPPWPGAGRPRRRGQRRSVPVPDAARRRVILSPPAGPTSLPRSALPSRPRPRAGRTAHVGSLAPLARNGTILSNMYCRTVRRPTRISTCSGMPGFRRKLSGGWRRFSLSIATKAR